MAIAAATGLLSGIPIDDLLSQLLQVEQRPLNLLRGRKATLQGTSAEFSVLSLRLSGLRDAASSLASLSNFNGTTASVTTSSGGLTLLDLEQL